MKFSDGEKLIILMLCEIDEILGIRGEIDPKFVESAISSDNTWGIRWKYSGIPFAPAENPAVVKEVVDFLDMWSFIEEAYEALDGEERKKVEAEAEPFGVNPQFPGFDGNHESDYLNVARFLTVDLNRFQRFSDRADLNSHSPSVPVYRRMFAVFNPMRSTFSGRPVLSVDQLIRILRERAHPERPASPRRPTPV